MKTILITGGAGFLGSNLCKALINKSDRIICIDNFYTGQLKNIEDLIDHKGFHLIEHDIEDSLALNDKFSKLAESGVDEIYNLACPASPPHYQRDPIKTIRTNVIGTLNMLELARANNAKILQASTSEVYGDPTIHPQPESYRGNVNPIGIRACYDEGKRCAETLCFDYNRMYGTRIKVIRIFNTYGPNMDPNDGRVVSNFILQALKGEDITVYGEGDQTRSFCYVDDLIDGMMRMMNSNDNIIGPINLGNTEEFTILELAEKIINKINSKSSIIYFPLPLDDPTQRKPIIELADNNLNWKPKISIDEGLIKTIEYFKNKIS